MQNKIFYVPNNVGIIIELFGIFKVKFILNLCFYKEVYSEYSYDTKNPKM